MSQSSKTKLLAIAAIFFSTQSFANELETPFTENEGSSIMVPAELMQPQKLQNTANEIEAFRLVRVAWLQAKVGFYRQVKNSLVEGRQLLLNGDLSLAMAGRGTVVVVMNPSAFWAWSKMTVQSRQLLLQSRNAMMAQAQEFNTLSNRIAYTLRAAKNNLWAATKVAVPSIAVGGFILEEYLIGRDSLYTMTMSKEKFDSVVADLDALIKGYQAEQKRLSDPMVKEVFN